MGNGECGEEGQPGHLSPFFKSLGGRYKRIRRRCKGKPNEEVYKFKLECLKELEKLSESGLIDLFYGDESHVCSEGYVPYGWQFPGEDVCIEVEKGHRVNCFGLISRDNRCHWAMSTENINAAFVMEQLERLSFQIRKQTFVVVDCASVHTAKVIKERLDIWQQRGLYIFYLPPYSPHLNIAETLWRKLKMEWLVPEDYLEKDDLFYATNRCLANVGKNLTIQFSDFNLI